MHEFLSTWYGLTIFIVFDVLALFVLVAIGYRAVFKRLFDWLLSILCLLFTLPAFLWVYAKYNAYKKDGGEVDGFLRRDPVVGKKGKTVHVTTFQTRTKDGELAGEYGKGLQERSLRKLPKLLDVFWGRASFVGVSALTFEDAAFLDDGQELRYDSRVGIISPVKKEGEPEEFLNAEGRYAHAYTIFTDARVLWGWILSKIRGERDEEEKVEYAKSLCEREIITKEEYESVLESALEEEKEWRETNEK